MAKSKTAEIPTSERVTQLLDEALALLKQEYEQSPKNPTYSVMTILDLAKLELKKI
jgi:hypothetical protein